MRVNSNSLKAEERRTDEANRLKSAFLANMGHDLRTPLNAIIGFADLLVKGKLGPLADAHKEYLGDILTSSHQLLGLLDGVLDFAKIESAKTTSSSEPLDLGRVVAEVRDILQGLAASRRIHVASDVDATVADVVLDASKLKHVLYSYLSNALRFTPEGGDVTIRVLTEGSDHFRLEVEDTGGGTAMAAGDAGSGRLALADGIVKAEGGRVGVRSRPGVGRTFWAVLARSGRAQHGE
jgi:signal transduction histidine kinase